MKKALIEKGTERVVQIVNAGEEFEVHSNLYWVDCDDTVQTYFKLLEDGTFEDPHAGMRDQFGNPVEPWIMQRQRAYASAGDQMDMLYKELMATGTISPDGPWATHIAEVKAAIPKPEVIDNTPPV